MPEHRPLFSVGGRIRLVFGLGFIGVTVLTGVIWWSLQRLVYESMWNQLLNVAAIAAKTWEQQGGAHSLPLAPQLTLRLTVMDRAGRVLADTYRHPRANESQADSPEVRLALAGQVARSVRHSAILDEEVMALALPLTDSSGRLVGVMRSSVSTSVVADRLSSLRRWLVLGFLVAAVLMGAMAEGLTRALSRPLEALSGAVADPNADLPSFEHGPREVVKLSDALIAMRSQIRSQLESLALQQKRQEDILMRLDDGVVVVEPSGDVVFANPAALRMLSIGLEALKGRQATDVSSRVLALAGTPTDRPVQIEVSDRGPWLLVDSVDMRWGTEQERAWMLVVRDVTEAVRLDRMRQEFVARASHELRTPITAVSTAVEALELGALDEPENRAVFLSRVRRAVDRLSRMASELLDLSVAEGTETADPKARCDVAEQVRQAIQGLGGAIEARRHRVHLQVTPETLEARIGDIDLQRVVSNVVENAVKYTPEAGEIEVEIAADADMAVITVRDNGPGIPVADVDLIFERFFRADPARTASGAGLGLTIARSLVHRVGGQIRAGNRKEGGACVTVQIPLALATTEVPRELQPG